MNGTEPSYVRPWHQQVDLGGLSLVLATDSNEPPSEAELREALLLLECVVAIRRRRRELGLSDANIAAGDRTTRRGRG